MNIKILIYKGLGIFLVSFSLQAADFEKMLKPFLENFCINCHDDEIQKGGVALHNLTGVTEGNAEIWKMVWEQVALKEMPPRNKKNSLSLRPDSRFLILLQLN